MNGLTTTEATYVGPNKLIGGTKKFKKTNIVDSKNGTTTTIKEKHDEKGLIIIETSVCGENGKEILYNLKNPITKKLKYEKVYNPKNDEQIEKFYHHWDVNDNLFAPSDYLTEKIIRKSGVVTEKIKYDVNGQKLYKYTYNPKTKTSMEIKFNKSKNTAEATQTINGKSETRYYDMNANRMNSDGSYYKYKNPEEEAKEWFRPTGSRNSEKTSENYRKRSYQSMYKNVTKTEQAKQKIIEFCLRDDDLKNFCEVLAQNKYNKKVLTKLKRTFALKYHPDKILDESQKENATRTFQEINAAFDVIEKSIK